MKEFEARLRRQVMREKMAEQRVLESFEQGSMPQIHVPVGVLAASAGIETRVSGD
jgi:hypothetical protein